MHLLIKFLEYSNTWNNMPYNYNKHRIKRIRSEAQLTMAQMLQTVLIEGVTPPPSSDLYLKF